MNHVDTVLGVSSAVLAAACVVAGAIPSRRVRKVVRQVASVANPLLQVAGLVTKKR